MTFQNREQAGEKLAVELQDYRAKKDLVVLAIPRGGVVVGKKIAQTLQCPLDVIVTKKIGAPGNPELAIGAVGSAPPAGEQVEPVINEELAAKMGTDEKYLKSQISKLKIETKRREKEFRGDKPPLNLKDKAVIITDDGVATGATMMAAIELVRQQGPKKIIVAAPVIAKDTLKKIEKLADEVIYLEAPSLFFAVGQFYRNFEQVSDEEVVKLLRFT